MTYNNIHSMLYTYITYYIWTHAAGRHDAHLCAFYSYCFTPTEYATICVHFHASYPARFGKELILHSFFSP